MARTDTARPVEAAPPEDSRGILSPQWVLVAAIAIGLLAFGFGFLRDPSISAPTRDPAWYTWRSNLMMHDAPKLLVGDWGPFAMFGGGKAALQRVGAAERALARLAGRDALTGGLADGLGLAVTGATVAGPPGPMPRP